MVLHSSGLLLWAVCGLALTTPAGRPLQCALPAHLPSLSSRCIPALLTSFLCVQGPAFPPVPQVSGTAHHWVFMLGEWAPWPLSAPLPVSLPVRCILNMSMRVACAAPLPILVSGPCHRASRAQTPPLSSLCPLGRSLTALRRRSLLRPGMTECSVVYIHVHV